MEFEITEERIKYINATGKVVLNACPGSGKTSTIVYKLSHLLKNWKNKYAGIACLSFTNVAKEEISSKYKALTGVPIEYPHIVSTIDSFINHYITLPFIHLIGTTNAKYKIIDDDKRFDEIIKGTGFLLKKYGRNFLFKYSPSSIEYNLNGELYVRNVKDNTLEYKNYLKEIKEYQQKMGLLTTTDSTYYATKLLKIFPQIGIYLSNRFNTIIVDEAQDTSEIQFAFIDKLLELGHENLELVGDPYQCIYEWRDAKPDIFLTKYNDKDNWTGLELNINRRSSQKIVDCFNILRCPSDPKIISAVENNFDSQICIFKYNSEKRIDILETIKKYEQKCKSKNYRKNHVVTRGNALINSILKGEKRDIRPWNDELPYELIKTKLEYENNMISTSMKTIRKIIINLLNPSISYSERLEIERNYRNDYAKNAFLFSLVKNIPSFDKTVADWTNETEKYLYERLEQKVDFKKKVKKSLYFDPKQNNTLIADIFNDPVWNWPDNIYFSNIHQMKGATADTLLLILNEAEHLHNLTFNDIQTPSTFPSEKIRLLYVALSRPRYLLGIALPKSIEDEKIYDKFGYDIIIN